MDWLFALLALSALEIVLGIDNVIFIAILVGRLPAARQAAARRWGLGLALVARLALLAAITWIMRLTTTLFTLPAWGALARWLSPEALAVSGKDLILFAGGLFLIAKSVFEIHDKLEGSVEKPLVKMAGGFGMVLLQIVILDLVFSLDSVITAVGTVKPDSPQDYAVIVAAIVIAILVMLLFAGVVSNFVHRHPTIKILALAFLILIGVLLVAESFDQHLQRGYIYFTMLFSLVIELINMRVRAQGPPVELHEPPPVS